MTMQPPVFSVTQLNRQIRSWLEHDVGIVHVEGELSNLSKPVSGHFYFTLKDASAQLRCVYFRNRHKPVDRNLQNGQQIIVRGTLSLYEARGDYQLIIDDLKEAGEGDLFQQFELLKARLAALGLFDAARKKQLPAFPCSIGVITSTSGAAIRDILITLARRYPLAPVLIYPSDVQGKLAAPQLTNAILRANQDAQCDVLILARGGGSIEDLWAFNDEHLALAIANSAIPVVSGVGHETDFTIADFVADLRAATPTAAAEAVTPDQIELRSFLNAIQMRLNKAVKGYIHHRKLLLRYNLQKIASPKQLVAAHWQTLDYLQYRLQQSVLQTLSERKQRLRLIQTKLKANNPRFLLHQMQEKLHRLEMQLIQCIKLIVHQHKQCLISQQLTLHAVSPLATLDRGYAIVSQDQQVIVDSQQVSKGDTVHIRLAKGFLDCEVL